MQWGEQQQHAIDAKPRALPRAETPHGDLVGRATGAPRDLAATRTMMLQPLPRSFGLNAILPPSTDPATIAQRADEVNTIQRLLGDVHASTVLIVGVPGVGKSILAALLYRRLQMAQEAGLPAPRYMLWLGLGSYTTLPDIIAAILSAVNVRVSGFFLMSPEQQIALLLQALRRLDENVLVVLDQFEILLHPEIKPDGVGQDILPLFLNLLQTDLGASRFLITAYASPYDESAVGSVQTRLRFYQTSRISIPEGLALLQQRGVQGKHDELSLVWQRCSGQALALVLFAALVNLSGISLSYLLYAPDYQALWSGEVTVNLIAALYRSLNPIQSSLLRSLCLFHEPIPVQGILMTSSGGVSSAKLELELGTLVRYAVVLQVPDTSGMPGFMLHPLVRSYVERHYLDGYDPRTAGSVSDTQMAANKLSTDPLQNALAVGHMQVAIYYQHLIRTQSLPREQRKELRDLEPIIAAVRHLCLGWRWQRAFELLFEEGLHECMVQWGAWHALLRLYIALLPPAGTLPPKDEGLVCSLIAVLYSRLGEFQLSMTYFEQARTIQHQLGDIHGEASTLTNQGELLRMHGEREMARRNFGRAFALNDRLQDSELACTLLHNLGLLFYEEQHYEEAFNHYVRAWRLAEAQKRQQHKGMILTNIGLLLYEQGLHQEGLAVLLEGLQLRQALHDPTVSLLETFLDTLEQRMGTPAYMQACRAAMAVKQEVLARFASLDVQQ